MTGSDWPSKETGWQDQIELPWARTVQQEASTEFYTTPTHGMHCYCPTRIIRTWRTMFVRCQALRAVLAVLIRTLALGTHQAPPLWIPVILCFSLEHKKIKSNDFIPGNFPACLVFDLNPYDLLDTAVFRYYCPERWQSFVGPTKHLFRRCANTFWV
jgi:hypothetical protein